MHNFNRGSTYRSICQCPSLPFSVPPIASTSPGPTSSSFHGLQYVSGLAYMRPHMTPFAKFSKSFRFHSLLNIKFHACDLINLQWRLLGLDVVQPPFPTLRVHQEVVLGPPDPPEGYELPFGHRNAVAVTGLQSVHAAGEDAPPRCPASFGLFSFLLSFCLR